MKYVEELPKHVGSTPAYWNKGGKIACKTCVKHGNYGTNSFTDKKRANRHSEKQLLKQYIY